MNYSLALCSYDHIIHFYSAQDQVDASGILRKTLCHSLFAVVLEPEKWQCT